MPKLPDIKYRGKGKTGEVVDFISNVLVTSDGVFHMTIPEYLKDVATTLSLPIEFSRGKWKIYGDSLSRCEEKVKKAIEEYLACTTEKSIVILCKFVSTCHFAKNNAGDIFPNGGFCPNDFKWSEKITESYQGEDYVLGFRAGVFIKLIHRRSASKKVEYETISSNNNDIDELGSWGKLLNEFVHVKLSYKPQELPYTEEMAKVFYEAMMGLCTLSDKLSHIFSSPEKLLSAPNILMLGKGSKC